MVCASLSAAVWGWQVQRHPADERAVDRAHAVQVMRAPHAIANCSNAFLHLRTGLPPNHRLQLKLLREDLVVRLVEVFVRFPKREKVRQVLQVEALLGVGLDEVAELLERLLLAVFAIPRG